MKKLYLWCLLAWAGGHLYAQTFNGSGGAIGDVTETCFDMQVSTGNQMMNSSWGLQSVCITFAHTYPSDLDIALISPTGTGYYLSTGNGNSSNFNGTLCFDMSSATPITSWNSVTPGNYVPENSLGLFNTDQTSQGMWTLCFYDNYSGDVGTLSGWSLNFGNSPAAPNVNIGQAGVCMIDDCGPISFYDPGGPSYAYGNNMAYTQTFCTDAAGQCIAVSFAGYDLETNYDWLDVYDGSDAASGTYLGSLTGAGGAFGPVVSTSGCLTFVFTSDFIGTRPGFAATIHCVAGACTPYVPPANDDCANATPLTGTGTNAGAIGCDMDAPDPWASACGWMSTENSVFFTVNVTASTPQPLEITLESVTCSGGAGNIQLALYDNNCASVGLFGSNFHGCASGVGNVTLTSTTNPLSPGTYILAVDGDAGADCNWLVTSPVLSVGMMDLLALYAPMEGEVKLSWVVENLIDSEGMEVERSEDMQNWSSIGRVDGLSMSSSRAEYTYADRGILEGREYHYRIKEIDRDGSFTYSNVETIYTGGTQAAELISAYPSPATDRFTLEFYLPEAEQVSFVLMDLAGRKIFELPAGQLSAGFQRLNVPLEGIASGMYIWRLAAGGSFDGRLIVE